MLSFCQLSKTLDGLSVLGLLRPLPVPQSFMFNPSTQLLPGRSSWRLCQQLRVAAVQHCVGSASCSLTSPCFRFPCSFPTVQADKHPAPLAFLLSRQPRNQPVAIHAGEAGIQASPVYPATAPATLPSAPKLLPRPSPSPAHRTGHVPGQTRGFAALPEGERRGFTPAPPEPSRRRHSGGL